MGPAGSLHRHFPASTHWHPAGGPYSDHRYQRQAVPAVPVPRTRERSLRCRGPHDAVQRRHVLHHPCRHDASRPPDPVHHNIDGWMRVLHRPTGHRGHWSQTPRNMLPQHGRPTMRTSPGCQHNAGQHLDWCCGRCHRHACGCFGSHVQVGDRLARQPVEPGGHCILGRQWPSSHSAGDRGDNEEGCISEAVRAGVLSECVWPRGIWHHPSGRVGSIST